MLRRASSKLLVLSSIRQQFATIVARPCSSSAEPSTSAESSSKDKKKIDYKSILKPADHSQNVAHLPIEKRSLSRGLFIDKFEKDFLIYPEFTAIDDLELLKQYI
uniref:Uncharacterized protein n=1 Tax=Plectus sambesii TaxID=2011161 RepID=A0A914VBM0_9BILA